MKYTSIATITAIALASTFVGEQRAEARSAQEINGPVFAQYKDLTQARKRLRDKVKKGRPMSGDEYYALANACQYEEAESPSIILTMLSRSRCKDKVTEYFVEAGMRGTPEGFLAASQSIGEGQAAQLYAQLAYRLSGTDTALRSDALTQMAQLRASVGDPSQSDAQATGIAQRLVNAGTYQALGPGAGQSELARALPQMGWLDFRKPKRCGWSAQSQKIIRESVGFDDSKNYPTVPAKVRVPGVPHWVTSRIVRPNGYTDNQVRVFIDFKGSWNGLTVLGLTHSFLEESEGLDATGIRFQEPVATVARKLAGLGYPVNANGSAREIVDKRDGYGNIDGVITSVDREKGETIFYCDEVFYASYGEG